MPKYEIQNADGRRFEVEAPDMQTAAKALQGFDASHSSRATSPGDGPGMNFAAGINSAIYSTLGAPVDAMTWALNKGAQGINAVAGTELGQIERPFGGSQSIAEAFGLAGVKDPAMVQAATPIERVARGAGEGVGYAVAPEAALAGLGRAGLKAAAPVAADMLGNVFGRAQSAGAVAGNAVAGGTAGLGASAAMEAVDDPYKALAGLTGGLAGGAVGTLATGLPRAIGEGVRVAGDYLAPISKAGQERTAANLLRDASTNPDALRTALANGADEIIPGSRPTTFQATGDMGIGSLERRVATQFPDAFQTRRAEQNNARVGAMTSLQPTGAPEAVASAYRTRLADIDRMTEEALSASTRTAQDAARLLGGTQTPETYGESLRGSLQAAERTAREQERALWSAVDPDGTLTLGTDNVASAARSVAAEMPRTAAPMQGEEAAIFEVASALPRTASFTDMSALRSRISTAMRNEMVTNGQSPAYARLSQLRGAIESDVEGVISRRAAEEAQAVAAGTMRPDATMEAGILRQVEAWRARRDRDAAAGYGNGAGNSATDAFGAGRISPMAGGEGQGGNRFSDAPGNTGLSGDAGGNFDAAARERLRAATQATKSRAQTFDAGTAGAILKRSGQSGPYEMLSSAVPGRIFVPGNKGGEEIARFRRAAGDGQALITLQDYAASQLRRTAERADGTLDPAKVAAWRRTHAEALRAFPDLDARFRDAAAASEAMGNAARLRREALDSYQTGLVGQLLRLDNPADVTRTIGSVFGRNDAATQMRQIAATVGNNRQAREGLRKAVADYVVNRFVSNTEAGTTGQSTLKSDQFQTFLRQNRSALRQVFGEDELVMLDRIAADLTQANRSLTAVKIPGQSNTAQDAFAISQADTGQSVLAKVAVASAAGGAGGAAIGGPIASAVAALGSAAVVGLRRAGMERVDELIRDAMLNPEVARALLMKAGKEPNRTAGLKLMQRYRRIAAAEALKASGIENDEEKQ